MSTYIIENWRAYFESQDEGLGTTYERFVLHRYFKRIEEEYGVNDVLEAPGFGMTGISDINSMWWARKGARVTIVDDNDERISKAREVWNGIPLEAGFYTGSNGYSVLPFDDGSFDMSWNFAALWMVPGVEQFLGEFVRVTRKVIFICIPNGNNLFSLLRPVPGDAQWSGKGEPGDIPATMKRLGWRLRDSGYLDAPPWPDIAMKKEDFLRRMGLRSYAKFLENKPKARISILDYFRGRDADLERRMMRYAVLENLPSFLKRFLAHHRYFIFIPEG